MEEKTILESLVSKLSNISVSKGGNDFILTLPFTDYVDDPIEASIFIQGNEIVIDDLGRVAGILFDLKQEAEDTAAYNLVKNLAEAYKIDMDLEQGILRSIIKVPDDATRFLDFMKVITALQVAIPEMKQHKKRLAKSKLVSRLGNDIRRLKLPMQLESGALVYGKNEAWPINYRYEKRGPEKTEVLIMTADLATMDPRQKASSIVASALDLMQVKNRDLRVVYEVDGIGSIPAVQRAKNLIDENQKDLRYTTFNYAEERQKYSLLELTKKDIVSFIK